MKQLFRLDFKEPSWDWDNTTPCQYHPSLEDAETAMRRAVEIDEQRFKNFRVYEQGASGAWTMVEGFNSEQPEISS